jgi:alpha-glucosidase
MLARASLVPYIYTGHRIAYETGLSLIRPMYYTFPEHENAYGATPSGESLSQYMFCGEDIMVSPVTTQAQNPTSMTHKSVWIPPGLWFDTCTGVLHTGADDGSSIARKSFDIREVPVFVRAGAVIPGSYITPGNTIGQAMRQYDPLIITIYPGTQSGETRLYEDDGLTTDYRGSRYAWTRISYRRASSSSLEVTIDPPEGHSSKPYPEFPDSRKYRIRVMNSQPARSVNVDGRSLKYDRYGDIGSDTYRFEGMDLAVVADVASSGTHRTVTIKIDLVNPTNDTYLSGIHGGTHSGRPSFSY